MSKVSFARQPVVYLILLGLILQTVVDIMQGHFQFSQDLWDQFVTAATGVVIWNKVTPVAAPNLSAIAEK